MFTSSQTKIEYFHLFYKIYFEEINYSFKYNIKFVINVGVNLIKLKNN